MNHSVHDPVQSAKSWEVRGNWVRWSRYDLLNGVIVPAPGAEIQEYDPWDKFRSNAGKYRTVEQPYTALLELHRNLKQAESRGIRPSRTGYHPRLLRDPMVGPRTEADKLILAWCNLHGLLGLVPVLSNSIRLCARIGAGKYENRFEIEKRHYFRNGGLWSSTTRTSIASSSEAAEAAARRLSDENPKPGFTWLDWKTGVYEEKVLEGIELFFRPVWKDEPLNLPFPKTPTFWKMYGEPLQDFTEWCEMFTRSVNYVSQWEAGKFHGEAAGNTKQSFSALRGLAQAAAPAFEFNPERNTVNEERLSAGLLASYALMFLWDREVGRRALNCENCESYFISNEPRARYCSARCRNTAQSRRYRSKRDASKG